MTPKGIAGSKELRSSPKPGGTNRGEPEPTPLEPASPGQLPQNQLNLAL